MLPLVSVNIAKQAKLLFWTILIFSTILDISHLRNSIQSLTFMQWFQTCYIDLTSKCYLINTLQLVDDTFAILLMMFFWAYCLLGHWTFYMSCNFLNWTLPLQTAFLTRQNFTACKYFKTKTWHEDFLLQIRPSVTWTTNLKQQDFDEFGVPYTCCQLHLKWVL